MAPRMLTQQQIVDLRNMVRGVLQRIDADELAGQDALVTRLEGVVVALSVVLGDTQPDAIFTSSGSTASA